MIFFCSIRLKNMDFPIVPFGKYKGQPITALINDSKYLEWCKSQEWFQKYPIIYNICVNQTIAPNDTCTPEHNKLQNLFLEQKFILQFISNFLCFDEYNSYLDNVFETEIFKFFSDNKKFDSIDLEKFNINVEFEGVYNWDVILLLSMKSNNIELKAGSIGDISLVTGDFSSLKGFCDKLFGHVDFVCYGTCSNKSFFSVEVDIKVYIEIKPLMGDDYPNVLRQMKKQQKLTGITDTKYFILFVGKYSSQHTTKEQIIKIFKQSDIKLVFVSDLGKS